MINNIGNTTTALPALVGAPIEFDTSEKIATIDIIAGSLGKGFLLSDENGTVCVCTEVTADEDGNPMYKFMTKAISTGTAIVNALNANY